jgi:hypothetical protein
LSSEEIADLVDLRRKSEDDLVNCGVAIVLGETASARMFLEKMSDEEKRRITEYPIYQLLLADEADCKKLDTHRKIAQ